MGVSHLPRLLIMNCLSRSQAGYSAELLVGNIEYMILAFLLILVTSPLLGMLGGKDSSGVVGGSLLATDIQGITCGVADDLTDWSDILGQGFIGFVRLVPVKGCAETEKAAIDLGVYSYGREDQDGSALPDSYCPIFSERDLMRQLTPVCREIIFVKIKDASCGKICL